jgi:uncharacterized protein YndB with AHSA1/START domain
VSDDRSIELEIEVPGTPEEVWRAIATGPGISSWYVPHTVEERQGGAANASFGAAPEMQVAGRVAAWEPPYRVVFDGGDADAGLAFEWLVEARDGGSCVVRLINSGFGSGDEWDAQYDGMAEGWLLFLLNLKLHLTHFAGQTATAMLPTAMWTGPREQTWADLTGALGLPAAPAVGERVEVASDGAPRDGGHGRRRRTVATRAGGGRTRSGHGHPRRRGHRRRGRRLDLELPLRSRGRASGGAERTPVAAVARRTSGNSRLTQPRWSALPDSGQPE